MDKRNIRAFKRGGALGGGGGGAAAEDEGAAPAEAAKEKDAFDIKLAGFDAKAKIKIIKEVRAITGLGLKEVGLFCKQVEVEAVFLFLLVVVFRRRSWWRRLLV